MLWKFNLSLVEIKPKDSLMQNLLTPVSLFLQHCSVHSAVYSAALYTVLITCITYSALYSVQSKPYKYSYTCVIATQKNPLRGFA